MNNDLISREALKEKAETVTLWNGDVRRFVSYETIDNAEPVEYTFEEAFQKTICEKRLYCPADIAADLSRLKAENNRLTAELERVYELYNGAIASKQEQPRKGCPFGDQRETCAEFRANNCDLCKFATS